MRSLVRQNGLALMGPLVETERARDYSASDELESVKLHAAEPD